MTKPRLPLVASILALAACGPLRDNREPDERVHTTARFATAGIAQAATSRFPNGVFYAVHDDQGVGAFDWRDIAKALALRTDCSDPVFPHAANLLLDRPIPRAPDFTLIPAHPSKNWR